MSEFDADKALDIARKSVHSFMQDDPETRIVHLERQVDELNAKVKFLDDSLDLALLDTQQDMTTARQEIEEEYGNDYFKEASNDE